jgi:AraC-like DNA-binding protein
MGNSVLTRFRRLCPTMKIVSLPRGRYRLHSMPTSTGYDAQIGPGYDWDGRRRGQTPFSVFQYTVAGAGNLLYEQKQYRLTPGDAMLVTIPHNHRYWIEAGGRWEFFWLAITGQDAVRVHRAIQTVAGPVFSLYPESVEKLAACCLRLIEGASETSGAASAVAYEATMILYDELLGSHSRQHDHTGRDSIQRAIDHVRTHLADPLTVPVLAEIAGLSRAHFSRQFTSREGMSPAEFVLNERITHAAKLLISDSATVKEVATACGFKDANYFAKAFRRIFNTSPTEFRTTGMYASQKGHRSFSR